MYLRRHTVGYWISEEAQDGADAGFPDALSVILLAAEDLEHLEQQQDERLVAIHGRMFGYLRAASTFAPSHPLVRGGKAVALVLRVRWVVERAGVWGP